MNERAMKVEKIRRKEIHRILDLIMDINGLDEKRDKKEGAVASFSFSGAYGEIQVNVYKNGYDASKTADVKITSKAGEMSFGTPDATIFELADRLEELKRELEI